MAQFTYKARSRTGEVMQGVLESVDRAGALSKLQRDGLFPVAIQPAKGKAAKGAKTKPGKTPDSTKPIKDTSAGGFGFRRKGRKPKLQDSATWLLQ